MEEFGNGPTVYDRFRQWRDAGAFQALMEAVIAEAARRDQVGLSPVGVDSTTARAHHDAAGMRVDARTLAALEKALMEGRGQATNKRIKVPQNLAMWPKPPARTSADAYINDSGHG
ncbi:MULTISPECIES: transposase [unclassified Streptomyces]|uniref:transposase n=1 Tax=unclassified Streptomyces TaxID=2593676 RepID=UPI000CD53D50|nr:MULTISPECIES: transposase [unclassified Streptomyces]